MTRTPSENSEPQLVIDYDHAANKDFVTVLVVSISHPGNAADVDKLAEGSVHEVEGLGTITVVSANYYVREDGELVDLLR